MNLGKVRLSSSAFRVLAMVLLGLGAILYVSGLPRAIGSGGTASSLPAEHPRDDETLSRFKDYARSIEAAEAKPKPSTLLPDVNTMIDRLAARLEAAPDDAKGWRMLGWSYFNTGRFKEAAAAYSRAVQLEPGSADLKASYEEAKAKASGSEPSHSPAPARDEAHGKAAEGAGPGNSRSAGIEALPGPARDAAIRAMVDGLADRLANAPRDVDGWTRLVRSRVVLGEQEVAVAALRKALDVFKDDPDASGTIKAAASELGLKVE